MSCIFSNSPFSTIEIFGLNIVMIIAFTSALSKLTKLPQWLFVVPVAFVLYKAFCLDTVFFNKEKTGIVSGVYQSIV